MTKKPCSVCSQLKDYAEIEYEADTDRPDFAAPYENLKITEPTVRNATGLIFCPECGQYYLEREWTPGGSEDALKTCYYESIGRISHLTAHKAIEGAVTEAKQWAEKNKQNAFGETRRKAYEELRAAASIEFKRLEKHAEKIVQDCLDALADRYANSNTHRETLERFYPGSKDANEKSVQKERKKDGERAAYTAEILGRYLEKIESPPLPLGLEVIRLLGDKQEDVSRAVYLPLLITLGKMKDRKEDLQKIYDELQKLKDDSEPAANLSRYVRRLKEGIGTKEFFRLPEEGWYDLSITDDVLLRHLQKLPGLKIINHIPPGYTEATIDFEYQGYEFSTDNGYLKWCWFVDEDCPEEILDEIKNHLRKIPQNS
ncbi:MAG: hypothetical protein HYV42_04070 [Candidatus Magasanikbacteria bacterium]|nr:hypothetical protein [Candidatus Magasanikbacteria bacterium]